MDRPKGLWPLALDPPSDYLVIYSLLVEFFIILMIDIE